MKMKKQVHRGAAEAGAASGMSCLPCNYCRPSLPMPQVSFYTFYTGKASVLQYGEVLSSALSSDRALV